MKVSVLLLIRTVFACLVFMQSPCSAENSFHAEASVGANAAIRIERDGGDRQTFGQRSYQAQLKGSVSISDVEVSGRATLSKFNESGGVDPISFTDNSILMRLGLPQPRHGYAGELRLDFARGLLRAKAIPFSKGVFLDETGLGIGIGTGSGKTPKSGAASLTLDYSRVSYENTIDFGSPEPGRAGNAALLTFEGRTGTFLGDVFQLSGGLRGGLVYWEKDHNERNLELIHLNDGTVESLPDRYALDRGDGLRPLVQGSIEVTGYLPELVNHSVQPYLRAQLSGSVVSDSYGGKDVELSTSKAYPFDDEVQKENWQYGVGISAGAIF